MFYKFNFELLIFKLMVKSEESGQTNVSQKG